MPVFYAEQGFTEGADATLAMRIDHPLTFDGDGNLTVSVGRGVRVNPDGALETNDLASSVFPPLNSDAHGNVTLAIAGGLQIEAQKLAVKRGPGLSTTNDDSLQVNAGKGLGIENGQLIVKATDGLSAGPQGLGVDYGPSLEIGRNGKLQVNAGDGLQILNNRVTLLLSEKSGLEVSNGQLAISPGPSLYVTDEGRLSVYTGEGIQVLDGRISLYSGPGLRMLDHQISVNPGPGLAIQGQEIIPDVGAGLVVQDSKIRVHTGDGLQTVSSGENGKPDKLQLRVGAGLHLNQGEVALKPGPGIQFDQDGRISIQTAPPLLLDGNNLTLRLRATGPIDLSRPGEIGLRLGRGLTSEDDSLAIVTGPGLTVSNNHLAINFQPPLGFAGNKLTVNFGNGLMREGNHLAVRTGRGIRLSQGKLETTLGEGLRFNGNSVELGLQGNNGLTYAQGVISANLGQGLELRDNAISVKLGQNLQFVNGAVTATAPSGTSTQTTPANLTADSPLSVANNKVRISLGPSLQIANHALSVKIGDGLHVSDQGISIRAGTGLKFRNGLLEVNENVSGPTVTAEPPLKIEGERLSLSLGRGLDITENKLELKIGPGLRFNSTSGTLNLVLGSGLTFGVAANNSVDQYEIRIGVTNPLSFDSRGKMTLNVGQGLQIQGSRLQVDVGDGISLEPVSKKLQVLVGRGLEYYEVHAGVNGIGVKLGPGLQYDSDWRIIPGPSMVTMTLWTGLSPPTNITWKGYTAPGSKMYLSLTRFNTGLVIGTVSMESNIQFGHHVEANSPVLTAYLLLSDTGELRQGSSLSGTWEVKDTPTAPKGAFVPSRTMYPIQNEPIGHPRESVPARSLYSTTTSLGRGGVCSLSISLNRRRSWDYAQGYSIIFYYSAFLSSFRQPFDHANVMFTYWTE